MRICNKIWYLIHFNGSTISQWKDLGQGRGGNWQFCRGAWKQFHSGRTLLFSCLAAVEDRYRCFAFLHLLQRSSSLFQPCCYPLLVWLLGILRDFFWRSRPHLGLHLSLVLCNWLLQGTTPILVARYLHCLSLAPCKVNVGMHKIFSIHLIWNNANNGWAGAQPLYEIENCPL